LRRSQEELEKRVEERTASLRASEERFRQMAESLDEIVWMFNLDFTECIYVSRAYETMWGRSCESLRQNPMSFMDAIHPEDRFFTREVLEQKFKKGIEFNVEVRVIHTDGSTLWVTLRGFPICDAKGRPYRIAGVTHDITARRRLEEALLDVAEREQQRIAQDLHDGLCNQLAGLNYLTKGLEKTLTGKSKTAAKTIAGQLRNAMEQARGIARGLHPITILPASLPDALSHLAEEQNALYGVTCLFRDCSPLPMLNPTKATHLYRIAQEAVHNAIKHGKSKRITIQLSVTDHHLTLSVRDNGIGYCLPTSTPTGIGTQIMRHRTDTIGGQLTIERAKRTGTVVTCTLPLLHTDKPKGSHGS
jgi:PAS domain S-box-containing protein